MIVLRLMLAVVVGLSFVAMLIFLLLGLAVTVATLRAARRERRLSEELDNVLEAIVGPRSSSSIR
jgi:Flp pilus assembly protein TadB